MTAEAPVRVESVRIPKYRDGYGSCAALAKNIADEGLHRPIVLWSDATLISGGRRLFAHMLLKKDRIPAVFVGTIEEAAKLMLGDNEDKTLATSWRPPEMCRLWEVMRRLDAPAAAKRLSEARRRGVALRRQTQSGQRMPGRRASTSEDYFLNVVAEAFGMSAVSARRIELLFNAAHGDEPVPDEKRELARKLLPSLDAGELSIWAAYKKLNRHSDPAPEAPAVRQPKAAEPPLPSAAARQQVVAWDRSLPQLEGLVAGLIELGQPNPALTWDQVGPAHARLSAVRRGLEKIIKQMKETGEK